MDESQQMRLVVVGKKISLVGKVKHSEKIRRAIIILAGYLIIPNVVPEDLSNENECRFSIPYTDISIHNVRISWANVRRDYKKHL